MEHDGAGLLGEVHRLVHATALVVERASDGRLTQAEAFVLWHLRLGPATMSDLHRAFGHRHSTLTSVVDRLERKALVTRENDARDRRTVVVSLTGGGKRAVRPIAAAFDGLEAEAVRGAGRAKVAAFREIVWRLIHAAETV